MFKKKLVIKNKTGLHARPASDLVALSKQFESKITISGNGAEVNPKSIISILKAGIGQGTEITLTAEGPDELKAGEDISAFIESLEE